MTVHRCSWTCLLVGVYSSLCLLGSIDAFQATTTARGAVQRHTPTTLTLHRDDIENTFRKATSHSSFDNPSCQSPLFRPVGKDNHPNKIASTLQSFMLAATIMATSATLATTANPLPASASLDISPGTTVVETSPELTPRKFVQSSAGTALKVTQTAYSERNDLTQSLQRLQTAAKQEVASTQAWQNIWTLLQKYGVDIGSQVKIRPPQDLQRAATDLLQEGKVNFIVNGEIVQVSVEYRSGKDTATTKITASDDAATETMADAATTLSSAPLPDDEWILKVEGYKGSDPNAVLEAIQIPNAAPGAPQWAQDFFDYCSTPYPEQYLGTFWREGTTYGDVLALEGVLAVGFIYAWSYAFYLNENEQVEKAAQDKKKAVAAKKKAAAAAKKKKAAPEKKEKETWKTPPPPADTSATAVAAAAIEEPPAAVEKKKQTTKPKTVEEIKETAEEDVQVSIDFDGSGQMVITATENKPRDSIFAFAQALYFPWLGMFVPSFTAPDTIVIDGSEEEEETEGVFPFLRALYFPWLGILQGK